MSKAMLINKDHTGGNESEARSVVHWLRSEGVLAYYGWDGIPEKPESTEQALRAVSAYQQMLAEQARNYRKGGVV